MADILSISTPAAGGSFLVLGLKGREQLNRLPEYKVDVVGEVVNLMVADQAKPVIVDLLLGNKAEVTFEIFDEKRFFSGYITHFAQGERHGRFRRYEITLRPWLWFATRTRNSKVFQKKSVKDIVDEVLGPYGGAKEWRLASAAAYPKLDYCVQYDEADYDFVTRLLQRAGINYFFEHSEGKHTLVFVDANSKFKDKENSDPISWANAFNTNDPTVCDWRYNKEVRSAKAVVHDHDYLATATKIEGTKQLMPIPPSLPISKLGDSEVFEYPGDVVNNSQLDAKDAQASSKSSDRAKLVLESLTSLQSICTCRTNTRDVAVGTVFELKDHPDTPPNDQNGDYIIVSAAISLVYGNYEAEELKAIPRDREGFMAELVCVSKGGDTIRPEVTVRKPMMRGPQTALVVGASSNEIETDKHGRVKIQFFWDREGTKNQNSSCWVRVATPWASKNFGMISLPRVGDEVLVDFLEGDPDRPIVVGSVYNDVNPPVWELPANATMSGVKTRTSKEGSADTANELRFEDKKDAEYIWFQAEKDFYRYVKRHSFEWIAENESRKTKKIRKEVIGEMAHRVVGLYKGHEAEEPLALQDHDVPVRYRNVWVRRLKGYDQP